MSFESFLQFWTVYNRQIIEFVFVFTFVLIVFTIYRQFFSKSDSSVGHHANTVSIDTSEIEEKLKKILENQSVFKSPQSEPTVSNASNAPRPVGDEAGKIIQEIEKLKADVKEREKVIEDLKKNPGAANVGAASKEDAKKWEDKIKELEGRLQEYEIISEDIADLSFYKEENARLQKEISGKGGAVSEAAIPVAPSPVPAAAVAAPVLEPPVLAKVEAAVAAPIAAVVAEEIPVPATPKEEAQAAAAAVDKGIDDDILREFAAAVEGQKTAEALPPVQEIDTQKLTESKELMGEFENFIKKG